MFENSGSKLKVWAQIVFFIGVLGAFIVGIVFGRTVSYSYYAETNFSFGRFLLIFCIGSFSSYISALAIYGLGEAADSAASALTVSRDVCDRVEKMDTEMKKLASALEEVNEQLKCMNTSEEKTEKAETQLGNEEACDAAVSNAEKKRTEAKTVSEIITAVLANADRYTTAKEMTDEIYSCAQERGISIDTEMKANLDSMLSLERLYGNGKDSLVKKLNEYLEQKAM